MASPQTENGYTSIANELLEALARTRIPGEEMQVFMVILRKTYGFKKKEDLISLSQFTDATGIVRQNVFRALKNLIEKNIVIKKDYSRLISYRIQKDYSKWKLSSKKITVIKNDSRCNQKRFGLSSKKINTKETLTKETIQKKKESPNSKTKISEDDKRLVQLLIDLMEQNNPGSYEISRLRGERQLKWLNSCRLMREKDGRTPEQIEVLIRFSQNDEFWKQNILSFPKLREKQDTLIMRYKKTSPSESGIAKWVRKQEERYGKTE